MTTEELMFYGGLLACVAYLIYILLMQISKSDLRNAAIGRARTEYENASNDQLLTKKKLLDSIEEIYGKDKAEKVETGTIWMGMPMHLLMVALGKANDMKESIYKGTTTEKWYYGEYQTRVGTYKYKLEITLEDDEVVGWKDLV